MDRRPQPNTTGALPFERRPTHPRDPLGVGRAWLGLGLLVIALPLGGCHFDDEVEEQPPEVGVADAAPDGASGCAEGAVEPCAIIDGCGGERACVGGEFGACIAPEERCDGVDNDCDGTADEGYADLGSACSAGEGACAADGVRVCDAAGEGVVCDAVAGAPAEEACNGLDDDCDGTADEEFGGAVPCETGEPGVCAAGTTACEAGGTICVRDAEPSAELCDGLDNDCDGAADEGEDGSPLVRECYDGPADTVGNGPCLGGTQTCEGGVYGACVGQVLPGAEICDGLDNDCDAETDDVGGGCACLPGETRDCYTGPDRTADVGACRMGTQACLEDGSTFGPCAGEVVPAGEVCATRDQDLDCDGDTDDVPGTGEACSVGVGACAADGQTVCGADDAVACDAVAGEPTVEVCDGIDNDCNGVIDDVAGLGDACRVGIGACTADGLQVCDLDAGALVCDAVAGEPAAEICDGFDNDCNGTTDDVDGLGDACEVGVGACLTAGVQICDLGAGALVCDALAGEGQVEICDGLDNDCDGVVDDVEGLGDACSAGVGVCQADGVRVCDVGARRLVCDAQAGQPGDETCDNRDEDCDGRTDEGVTRACYPGPGGTRDVGTCRSGTQSCNNGAFGACQGAVTPVREFCSGRDDDCNGEVDDLVARFAATDFPADEQCFDFAVGDLNRNGRPDVVCSLRGFDGRLAYWLDAGVGDFGAVRYTAAAPSEAHKVELADLDGDGDPDLVGVGPGMRPHVFINDDGNLRAPVEAFGAGARAAGLALTDMTGDGAIDIVTSIDRNGAWRLAIARGNGNGTFAEPAEPVAGPELNDIAIGDIDQDGDIDVLGLGGGSVGVFRANGGNFADHAQLIDLASFPQKMSYVDYTGDGRRDLAVGGNGRWFFGRAQGAGFAFTESRDVYTIEAATDTEIDCDPLRDLAMISQNPAATLRLVVDPQTQSRPLLGRFAAEGYDLESLDVTGDGLEDLIVPDDQGGFHLLRQLP